MPKKFLLAAEVDKIQEYIFRSSKLREIVGASRLITKFCFEDAHELFREFNCKDDDILVADGGSFRILFNSAKYALDFGDLLAELYFQITGGSLTVAAPIEYDSDDKEGFHKANTMAQETLRQAKMSKRGSISIEHFPLVAICAFCGLGLAADYCKVVSVETDKNYTCRICLAKRKERTEGREEFLDAFTDKVKSEFKNENVDIKVDITGREEEIQADLNYVAYLKTDGNSMGKLFSKCEIPAQLRDLSKNLNNSMLTALAKMTADIIKTEDSDFNEYASPTTKNSPVVPLIMGGDDCFAILPAKYALAGAQNFCQYFTEEMSKMKDTPQCTLSASLAICKKNYPYYFAHQTCEKLMLEAKRAAYRWQQEEEEKDETVLELKNYSTVTFALIQGSFDHEKDEDGKYRPTAKPYGVSSQQFDIENPPELKAHALPLDILLESREFFVKNEIAATRLQALRQLYHNPPQDFREQPAWESKANNILCRSYLKPNEGEALEKILKLATKDAKQKNYWWLRRCFLAESLHYGHFMPDIIEMWDFSHKLAKWS